MAGSAENPDDDGGRPEGFTGNHTTPSGTSDNNRPSNASPVALKWSTTTPPVPQLSASSSATNSPRPSREGSPTRPLLKSSITTAPNAARSRKNSQDQSPIRASSTSASSIPTIPSAAAVQRALSAAGTPHLPPHTKQDTSADVSQPQKTSKAPASGTGLKIPRLSSPPPAAFSGSNKSVLTTPRKVDSSQSKTGAPNIVVDRPSRSTVSSDSEAGEEDRVQKSGMRTPVRGTSGSGPVLETVQESSLPSTPVISGGRPGQTGRSNPNNERPERIEENPMEEALAKEAESKNEKHESGNESSGKKSLEGKSAEEGKGTKKSAIAANSARPPVVSSKRSFTQLPFTKAPKAAAEGSVKNMTVETETVSSIPQVALGGGPPERNNIGRTETGGSVRLKPSNETIRPKKDKKKVVRKAPSLNAGNASTKADIFEAKIATAVDEANSSDSEETFVYESNPPEPHSARPHRFHSRTPSAASTASHYDGQGMKNRQDGHHTVVGKRSMKFGNNYYSIGYANDDGTIRVPSNNSKHTGNTTPHHHHHHRIGRYGRGGHPSLFDSDSPFPNATKSPQSAANHLSRFSPKLSSPRSQQIVHVSKSPRKAEGFMSYDLEGEGADDERTPLIGSNRSARTRRRPLPGSVRQMYSEEKAHRLCGRATAWTTLGTVLSLIIAAIIAVVVLCSKPLVDVYVKDIRNVLASEQEIMLDLHVHAMNPNLVAIQVSELDINIFAKSKYVGTNELWRSHQPQLGRSNPPSKPGGVKINSRSSRRILDGPSDIVSQLDGIDEGTDPIEDPGTDSQTMLLGQIFEFDSPLVFDPSPIHHHVLGSVGEVRLAKPGNRTEEGGSQRWERVIQHDFELIVRGVMRYSLPISSRLYGAKIAGRVVVHPNEGIDESGSMKTSKPSWPFEPGSNVLLHPPRPPDRLGTKLRISFTA